MLCQSALLQDALRYGTMKYQLVLQFAASSTEDFDRLVALEDRMIGELDDLATVDGHDFGLGEFNIFILTDDPAESFGKAQRVVAGRAYLTPCAQRTDNWMVRTT